MKMVNKRLPIYHDYGHIYGRLDPMLRLKKHDLTYPVNQKSCIAKPYIDAEIAEEFQIDIP